jgi:hypothetical protein
MDECHPKVDRQAAPDPKTEELAYLAVLAALAMQRVIGFHA